VYLLPLRHPLHVARTLATAANLSGGRVTLGVGVGWMREECDAVGIDFSKRGAIADEALEAIRKLWQPGPVTHQGRFFSFGPVLQEPTPRWPIPILIGGVSPAAIRRAVRAGDGYILPDLTAAGVEVVLDSLREGLEAAGREIEEFTIVANCGKATSLAGICEFAQPGVDVLLVHAWPYQGLKPTTLAEKIRALEEYARDSLPELRARLDALG
jgi:alkanesulfonate monooxygenase SsuD/methylene tetrahydromethanopterin reductase-like flavin-dependent oxidoreductase (luciferase family)